MDSVAPSTDSLFIRQVRTKMARIRATQHRPTVGLVLSGGGAKGAAEVGTLMLLEELDIPVDLICGTSIGGLIGGLYAIGYDSEDLRELFTTQDWDVMLSDAVDQKYIPYSTKMYRSKFLVSVPFHNADEVFEDKGETFGRALPSGFAYGFNVGNLLSSLTVGYQDSISFRDLPIPYVCVAADMVSSKAKNWGSGHLKTAMRSTMSIPGLFDPVRTEGMVLVDGGVRNNFPADIAKAMGADYIIGVELSDLKPSYDEVSNIGNILSQFITMLGNDAYDKNVHIPDVFIKPDLHEFNMMSFDKVAVDTMINRGYRAAKAQRAELLKLKRKLSGSKYSDNRSGIRKATNLAETGVRLASIEFEGLEDTDAKMMFKLLDFQAGDIVDKEIMDDAMSKMQATGAFSEISYSLLGEHSPYRLVFHCKTSPTHSMGVGFRIDTEEWASLLFNLGINNNKLSGSKFNVTAKIGQNLKLDGHYSVLDNPWLPTLNFDISIARYKGMLGSYGQQYNYEASYFTHKEQLYITDIRWTKYNFRAGIKNQYNNVNRNSYLGNLISTNFGKDALSGDYIGAFLSGNLYTFDNYYYPSSGINLAFEANYDFAKIGDPDYSPVLSMGLDLKSVIKMNDKWALTPEFYLRNVIGNSGNNLSILHANFIGGAIGGRYTDSHVPFFGIGNVMMMEEYMASVTMGLRFNPYKKLYLSAKTGLVKSADTFVGMVDNFAPTIFGIGAEAAYNFAAGPVKFCINWSDAKKWNMYMSFGFDF